MRELEGNHNHASYAILSMKPVKLFMHLDMIFEILSLDEMNQKP